MQFEIKNVFLQREGYFNIRKFYYGEHIFQILNKILNL